MEASQLIMAKKILDRMRNIEFDRSFANIYNPEFAGAGRFQWSTGVGLYGALKLWQLTKDEEIFDYLCGWFDGHIKKGLPKKNINTMCPFLTLSYLYEESGNKIYESLCIEWAKWLYEELPRTNEKGFVHLTGSENEGQLWMDTLFVSVLFLAKMGVMLSEAKYIREAERQFLLHTKYLCDRGTGLFFHGYSFLEKGNFSEAIWGRGNGWYSIAVMELLEIAGDMLEETAKDFIIESFKTQMAALKEYQDEESGMWRTLIDDKESYLESTGTTSFVFGMTKGINSRILDDSYIIPAKKGYNAIISRIADDGTVLDASGGTPIFETLAEYKEVVKVPIVYGQGKAIMMLCEHYKAENIN